MCSVIMSRIKDALLLVDDHPDFKTMSSKGEMLSLSDSKKDMQAYVKLTGSGFDLWINYKLSLHALFFLLLQFLFFYFS